MQGDVACPSNAGIVARTVSRIFEVMAERQEYGWNYTVDLEMLELYNESFRDLIEDKVT